MIPGELAERLSRCASAWVRRYPKRALDVQALIAAGALAWERSGRWAAVDAAMGDAARRAGVRAPAPPPVRETVPEWAARWRQEIAEQRPRRPLSLGPPPGGNRGDHARHCPRCGAYASSEGCKACEGRAGL